MPAVAFLLIPVTAGMGAGGGGGRRGEGGLRCRRAGRRAGLVCRPEPGLRERCQSPRCPGAVADGGNAVISSPQAGKGRAKQRGPAGFQTLPPRGVGRGIEGEPSRFHVLADGLLGLLNPAKAPLQNHKDRTCRREVLSTSRKDRTMAGVPHLGATDPTLCLARVEGLPRLPVNFEDTEASELRLPRSLCLADQTPSRQRLPLGTGAQPHPGRHCPPARTRRGSGD